MKGSAVASDSATEVGPTWRDIDVPIAGKKLISSSAIYTFGDFLTTAMSGFLLIPLYLKFMTPADYGLYSTLTVMISMVGVLMTVGMTSAVGRFYFIYLARREEYSYLGSVWLFQTIVALLLAGLFAVWGEPLWKAVTPKIPFGPYVGFVLLGAFSTFGASIYSIWLRVQGRPVAFVVLQVINASCFALLAFVFLVLLHGGARGALSAAVGSSTLLALVSLAFLWRRLDFGVDIDMVRPSLRFGSWMMVGTLGYFLLNKSQLFFIQHYGDLTSVGVYNLGQQLGGALTLLALSFSKAWQPHVYSAKTGSDAAAAIARASKFFVAVMLYAMLGIALLSHEIIYLLHRPEYYAAGTIIRLVAIASFVYTLATLTSTALLYQKRADLTQMTVLVSAVLNTVLNVVLIPHFHMVGAAIAMLISFAAMVVMAYLAAQNSLPVAYEWRSLSKLAGLAAVLLASEWLLVAPRVGAAATSVRLFLLVAYPVLVLLTGAFTSAERATALEAVGLRWPGVIG